MKIPWYHKTTIYQIYPRSFYDSNQDGIGEIKGILSKLNYLHELGFETLWISPFFSSPQTDFGYDICNYTDIAPEYGSMDDALQLIDEVHKRGMKIVFDMVMNHTSIEHEWFKESRSSRDNSKADWYLWQNSPLPFLREKLGLKVPPNNWKSMTGGNGWHYAKERDEYYWSSFLPFQPDLNYRNPEVKKAIFEIVRFWLRKGVDGFRLDIFNVIYKDAEYRNNPFSPKLIPTEEDPSGFFQEAKYTMNQPESFSFAKELRNVCNEFGEKILLGEITGNTEIIKKYMTKKGDGLGLVFNFEMLNFKFNADYFRELINKIERDFPDPFMPVYVFSNHDRRRSIHRIGEDFRKAKLLHLLQLTVRGVPAMYYGEEIGMTDSKFPFSSALDPIPHKFKWVPRVLLDSIGLTINRDEVRTPMQWDESRNSGFSSAQKTWLPVHENFKAVNIETETKDANSLLNTIRKLLKIRTEESALREGSLDLIGNLPKDVLGYKRKSGSNELVVLLNFGMKDTDFETEKGDCIFRITEKDEIKNNKVELTGYGGIILKFPN
ncbi:MAG: alpha-amylase family glycosyl hydrolase [Chloroflexi bacterium]|nr:alpha-amylase family glycosyl hydrolase [Chloroflexota bacterium]